ncbi:MAG: hypothetical protein ACOZF0_10675 [Thermodesulfobacteriota bacterium]
MPSKQKQNERSGIERRIFSYSHYIPERRTREDRRTSAAHTHPADHSWGSFSGLLTEKNAA